MASSQGQDVIRCQLCLNSVEHHCNLCHTDLCFNCVSKHLTDKSKRHEVVDFINKKEELILPECKSHDNKLCEMYCNDCHEPTCVLCVTTTHKKHDITDIKSIIDNLKKRIAVDVAEMEKIIRPKYKRNVDIGNSSKEFDKVINAIQDEEDYICKVVREIGSRLKDDLAKQKREFEKNKEVQASDEKEEKELSKVIKSNEGILESNDANKILTYQSKIESLRREPKATHISFPLFLSGKISRKQLQEMFGSLQTSGILSPKEKHGMRKTLSNPIVISIIHTPYTEKGELWKVFCEEIDNIWITGNDSKIYQIDQSGSILKTINVSFDFIALSFNAEYGLIFFKDWSDSKIYRYDGNAMRTLVDVGPWLPRGQFYSANGDLLLSMRSVDTTQTRVVRYSGTKENMVIQNDSQGKPLFSVNDTAVLLLTENGNGDICVADYDGNAVVVVNASGELRFKYGENISSKSNYKSFQPHGIVTNVNEHILINDFSNDVVHVIDRDGHILSYIEYPCNGGLSIDAEHNLVAGEEDTGNIRIIKYLA